MLSKSIFKAVSLHLSIITRNVQPGFAATVPGTQIIDSSSNDTVSAETGTSSIAAIGLVDPLFRVLPTFTNVDIDETDCLMNVVLAMAIISASEFTQLIHPRYFSDPRYPSILIQIRGPAGWGPIEARFLLWGFFSGIRSMIQGNKWKVADFTLLWEGGIVGFVSFGRRREGVISLPQGDNSTGAQLRRSAGPSPDSRGINRVLNPASENPSRDINVELTRFGDPIPKMGLFMSIFECFLYLGPRTRGDVLQAFTIFPTPYDVNLHLEPLVPTPDSSFDYGVAGLGLPSVPSKLITERQQRWTEVNFSYRFGNVLVGKG